MVDIQPTENFSHVKMTVLLLSMALYGHSSNGVGLELFTEREWKKEMNDQSDIQKCIYTIKYDHSDIQLIEEA